MISPASKKLLEECGIDEEEFQEALNMVKELRIKKKEEQGLAKATVTEATARVAEVEAGMDPIIDNFLVEATTETRSPTTCSPRVCLGLSFTSSTAAPLPINPPLDFAVHMRVMSLVYHPPVRYQLVFLELEHKWPEDWVVERVVHREQEAMFPLSVKTVARNILARIFPDANLPRILQDFDSGGENDVLA
ncbi:hypothetical protein AAF712_013572 [Marasmius tenuissimus]|uniref:Uncharacterized protein n=1 Tax=Marasmius tenuissimus TaxID=585030 RepID=A0ABR2ZFF7_9AGAR